MCRQQQKHLRCSSDERDSDEEPSVPDYWNPNVVQRNRLPSRAYHIPSTSLLLNGEWSFNYSLTPAGAPDPAVYSKIFEMKLRVPLDETQAKWAPIKVPGHWQLQGYGRPHYLNIPYPFPCCPPFTPSENATGTYRRDFFVPSNWPEKSQLRLRFDGVDSAYYVWLNGTRIGYSQGSRNPAEFDVTDVVRQDNVNHLLVQVMRWCDGSYLEDQDQWWLSGKSMVVPDMTNRHYILLQSNER